MIHEQTKSPKEKLPGGAADAEKDSNLLKAKTA
jgi:hypothetical protein